MARRALKPRTRARRLALQALYQWQLSGQSPLEVETQFMDEQPMEHTDIDYFRELLRNTARHAATLDGAFEPLLDRPMAQIDPVERAILRIGAFELGHRPEIPSRVVIDEAVELAKAFGAEQSHKYINGILDKVAHSVRATEFAGGC